MTKHHDDDDDDDDDDDSNSNQPTMIQGYSCSVDCGPQETKPLRIGHASLSWGTVCMEGGCGEDKYPHSYIFIISEVKNGLSVYLSVCLLTFGYSQSLAPGLQVVDSQ